MRIAQGLKDSDVDSSITSALLGGVSGATVSAIVAFITPWLNQKLERQKLTFSMWQEKRASAVEEIYLAFSDYLSFLWRHFYFYRDGGDVSPMHEFREKIEKNILYFDSEQARIIAQYQGELLKLWNTCVELLASGDDAEKQAVRELLESKFPFILPRLRADLVRMVDPYGRAPLYSIDVEDKGKAGLHGIG